MLGRLIALAPVAIGCGLLLGIGAAGTGVDLPDPYLGATIVPTFLPLLARDPLFASVWAGAGLAAVRHAVTRLRAGVRRRSSDSPGALPNRSASGMSSA